MANNYQDIINQLPYTKPFLFVDELVAVSENGVEGKYTFKKDEYFYQGHFKDNPITPGVILTECMAQIGVVCLGFCLVERGRDLNETIVSIAMSESHIEFLLPVFPGETVSVVSEKVYFRFGKLKCKVNMFNAQGAIVCKGAISGMTRV